MSKFTGQSSRPNSILFWVLLLVAPGRSLAGESDLVHFTLADMDGDRDRDVVVARDGTISVLLNSGNASLMATAPISATQVSRVAAGDINGDGLPDVASLQQNLGTLVVHLNSGSGQIASGASFVVGGDPSAIALIDLDRDRDLDIAVTRRAAGDVFLLFNDGTGLFPLSATVTVGATPHLLLPSDIDRDGFPDLVVFHDTQPPRLHILRNLGNRNFEGRPPMDLSFTPSGGAAADLTGDRLPDLALADFTSDSLQILRNEGEFHFVAGDVIQAGSGPTSIAARDIDSDGDSDLAIANAPEVTEATRGVLLLFNNGDGTSFFSNLVLTPDNSVPLQVEIADMNRNCRPDIVVALDRAEPIRIVLNEIDPPPLLPHGLSGLLMDRLDQEIEALDLFCGARRWYRQP